jgi:hypothetical protein
MAEASAQDPTRAQSPLLRVAIACVESRPAFELLNPLAEGLLNFACADVRTTSDSVCLCAMYVLGSTMAAFLLHLVVYHKDSAKIR